MSRARRPDSGVTIVEAAFALPILLMFFMGLFDLGLWSFNSNQATNAARDGARAAIVDHVNADVPGSPAWNRVVATVSDHLPGRTIGADDIDIECITSDGASIVGGCSNARVDVDKVRVSVGWKWKLITPIAGTLGIDEGDASGVASMVIVGKPVAGIPPTTTPPSTSTSTTTSTVPSTSTTLATDCSISNIVVAPSPARRNGSGMLEAVTITFSTNGVDRCTGLAVQLTPYQSTHVQSAVCRTGCETTSQSWLYDTNNKVWSSGPAAVRIFNDFVSVQQTFTVSS